MFQIAGGSSQPIIYTLFRQRTY